MVRNTTDAPSYNSVLTTTTDDQAQPADTAQP